MKNSSIIRVPFDKLSDSDLVVDAIYEGGKTKNKGSDVIHKLLQVMNSRGFRIKGSAVNRDIKYCILKSTGEDLDWPDILDSETGQFIYYGDNKKAGSKLLETKTKGNLILDNAFEALHNEKRNQIPPFFVFIKYGSGWDVQFKGLAVPGSSELTANEDLTAIWRQKSGHRFQNYKAVFTILDVDVVSRDWINDLIEGKVITGNTPLNYSKWLKTGNYIPLKAPIVKKTRTRTEQLPTSKNDNKIIKTIYDYYKNVKTAYDFEYCAIELAKLMDKNIIECDRTRPWRDGGRDAIGKYRIGKTENGIEVIFALEAKRYDLKSGIGVKHTSRLISRLIHRQFGIFITTSFLSDQAYKEIVEDEHPVIVISANDIVRILKIAGFDTSEKVLTWLKTIEKS